MDNFDFKKYLAENRIHADHDLLSEKKEDSKKGNKEEQKRLEGAIRDNRDHKFDIDKDEDDQRKKLAKLQKDAKKEDGKGKKGNEDEQKRAEGAIRDAKDHKKNLDKDIKADEKKLAKLKKDFKKDVVKENEQVDESALAVAAGVASVFGGAAAMAKIMDKLEAGDLGEKGKKVADVLSQLGKGAANRYNEGIEEEVEEGYGKPMYDEDDTDPVKEQSSKMRVSELKAKIREDILSTLNEDEDVDVDVDFEDEVNVDAEGDDIEIEKPAVKAKVQVGLSPEETIVQDSLKAAMDAADALGNDKLADQIGNTITFFTREYVVGRNTD
jgi:urease accessory protein UreE